MEHKNVDTTQISTVKRANDTVVGDYKNVRVNSANNKTDSTAGASNEKNFTVSSMENQFI